MRQFEVRPKKKRVLTNIAVVVLLVDFPSKHAEERRVVGLHETTEHPSPQLFFQMSVACGSIGRRRVGEYLSWRVASSREALRCLLG